MFQHFFSSKYFFQVFCQYHLKMESLLFVRDVYSIFILSEADSMLQWFKGAKIFSFRAYAPRLNRPLPFMSLILVYTVKLNQISQMFNFRFMKLWESQFVKSYYKVQMIYTSLNIPQLFPCTLIKYFFFSICTTILRANSKICIVHF